MICISSLVNFAHNDTLRASPMPYYGYVIEPDWPFTETTGAKEENPHAGTSLRVPHSPGSRGRGEGSSGSR